jgi:hypothetical protein
MGGAQRAVSSRQRRRHFQHHIVKVAPQAFDLRHAALMSGEMDVGERRKPRTLMTSIAASRSNHFDGEYLGRRITRRELVLKLNKTPYIFPK